MKKYSFQMTKEEVRELCFRAIWERLILLRLQWLLLPAVLVLECIYLSWTVALATCILLLVIFVALAMWSNFSMQKQLCKKTRTMEVKAGLLKPGVEGELYCEIPCSSITEFRRTRHLLMLGFRQASKVIAWYPVPLRVFANEQERDSFIESVKSPHTTVPDMEKYEETSVADIGVQPTEKSEQEYFRVTFQVGEEEWIRMKAAATEIIQAGTLGEKKNHLIWIVLAAALFVLSCEAAWLFRSVADVIYIMSLIVIVLFLSLLRNLLENPEKNIRNKFRRGMVQNNVLGVWETSVTEMGIRQSVSGKNSAMIPWESLLCVVETDNELFFFQKDKKHFSVIQKKGLESREQIESLKGLCREKRMKVLAEKRKKYAPGWLFSLLIAIVIVVYAWLIYTF